jgi:hypothetical protein
MQNRRTRESLSRAQEIGLRRLHQSDGCQTFYALSNMIAVRPVYIVQSLEYDIVAGYVVTPNEVPKKGAPE